MSGWLVLAVGPQQAPAVGGHQLLEALAGDVLSAITVWAGDRDAVEQLGGDYPLADVRGGELIADRHAVRGAEQVETESPRTSGCVRRSGHSRRGRRTPIA